MSKARPKTYVMYRIAAFGCKAVCYIHCYPQQKWVCKQDEKNTISLSRKNITFTIPKADFENYWKVVE